MRVMGHNALAILLAAIAIYALEFVIFAVLISPEQYLAMTGYSAGNIDRMAVGVVPPILIAIGLSLVIKWRNQPGWLAGAVAGLLMAFFFAFATCLYPFVYGPNTLEFLAVNLGAGLVCYAVAGAILGAWK